MFYFVSKHKQNNIKYQAKYIKQQWAQMTLSLSIVFQLCLWSIASILDMKSHFIMISIRMMMIFTDISFFLCRKYVIRFVWLYFGLQVLIFFIMLYCVHTHALHCGCIIIYAELGSEGMDCSGLNTLICW